MNTKQSKVLFEKAKRIIPGGANSPVRAFDSVGLNPPFIQSAKGSKIRDIDGNEYIDYVGSWGPMILGHAPDLIIEAIIEAVKGGTSFGAPTSREVELAELISAAFPSVEMLRMVSSGTEAVMSAIRLARGYTGRDKILIFEGCYHGHADGMLVKTGYGALTTGVPDSVGVPIAYAKNTITAPYNNSAVVEEIFQDIGDTLAGVIIEPVAGNMGVVLPQWDFLQRLRKAASRYGVLLIFDETITGFRVGYHGAQGYYGITPDLTVFGKIIGGGIPVGAYGGRKEIMSLIAPAGPLYQAGALSGNPVAVAAGLATLTILKNHPAIYDELDRKAAVLENAFQNSSLKYRVELVVNRMGSMLCPFFTDAVVMDYQSAIQSDTRRFAAYFKTMLENGIYLPPSQFETMFVSSAHDEQDLERTIRAIDLAFAELAHQEAAEIKDYSNAYSNRKSSYWSSG